MAKQPKRLTRAQKIEMSRIAAKSEKVKIIDQRRLSDDLKEIEDKYGLDQNA